jgi:hypothetical protein
MSRAGPRARSAHIRRPRLWVPETVHTTLDLLLCRQPVTGMIRRWRWSTGEADSAPVVARRLRPGAISETYAVVRM